MLGWGCYQVRAVIERRGGESSGRPGSGASGEPIALHESRLPTELIAGA
jgi:hypothetical protein